MTAQIKNIDKIEIGKRIKQLRESLPKPKRFQRNFAENIGKTQTSLSEYERGITLPDENTLIRICNYSCVSLQWLLYGHGEMDAITNKDDKNKINTIESTLAESLNLNESEMNDLINIAKASGNLEYFKLFIKAIKGDEQAKKDLIFKLAGG